MSDDTEFPTLLTVADVAARMRVDPVTVRRWINDEKLPAIKIGRTYRIEPDALRTMVRSAS
mgnify:CR=1 FL=1